MHVFIINTKAGRGKGKKVVESFLKANPKLKAKCKTFYTTHEGHATALAEQIAGIHHERLQQLIVVGGDGTFYEVLNGLRKFTDVNLAFVPVGSGNDFARGLQSDLKARKILDQLFKTKKVRPFWLGNYQTEAGSRNKVKRFTSSIGFGVEAQVAKRVNESRIKRFINRLGIGKLIYVYGLLATIFPYKPKKINLHMDGEHYPLEGVWLLTVSNHPYFGGGMKIAPDAKNNPDQYTVTIVKDISRVKLLALFITVFFGKHTSIKEVDVLNGRQIEVSSAGGGEMLYQVDGYTRHCTTSYITKEETPIRIRNRRKSR